MEAGREVSVKLRGRRFRVSHDEANQVLKNAGISAHGINRGKAPSYFLVVDGRKIPIKQALKAIIDKKGLDLTILDVTTKDAVGLFRRLDFPIVVEKGKKGSKAAILKYAGMFAFEGSSVTDKKRLYDTP
ncbi:MAG: hypothetical protein DRH15_11430 [Deltaproteobacteria bacterium]|nr:MAG: hypothetical protein DRH15_11430 [Deltaproteobacteria bacterium]